jgi:hypothetical protein
MRSIHVPASVVYKIVRVLQWLTPLALTAAFAGIGVTWHWIVARVDRVEVASMLTEVTQDASNAKIAALAASSRIPEHTAELALLWREVVMLKAELLVSRRYAGKEAGVRNELIQRGKVFYANLYDTERETRPGDAPSKSAERALRFEFRPDKP